MAKHSLPQRPCSLYQECQIKLCPKLFLEKFTQVGLPYHYRLALKMEDKRVSIGTAPIHNDSIFSLKQDTFEIHFEIENCGLANKHFH